MCPTSALIVVKSQLVMVGMQGSLVACHTFNQLMHAHSAVGHLIGWCRAVSVVDARGGARAEDKMAEFERQVEELSGRVSSLMQEKMTLETRNSLLERVVQLKQETDSERVRRL